MSTERGEYPAGFWPLEVDNPEDRVLREEDDPNWMVADPPEDSATVAGWDTEAVAELEEAMSDLHANDSGSGYYNVADVPSGFYVAGANASDYRNYYPVTRVEVDRKYGFVTLFNRSNRAMRTYAIRDRVLAVCPSDIPDPVETIDPREYL